MKSKIHTYIHTYKILVTYSERKSTVFTNEDVHEKIKKTKRSYDKILIY